MLLLNAWLLSAALLHAMTPPGNALAFNGTSQYVDVGTGASLNLTGAMTIEAWVKPTSQYNMQTVFGHKNGGSANPGYALFINSYLTSDAKLRFETQNAAVSTNSAAITWGVWQHVAVTWNGVNAHIYVNGVEQAAAGSVSLVSSTVNGHIGATSNNGAYYYGTMDEMRIWNIARTQTQIQDAMHHVLTGSESGLKAYYQFDASSGTVLPDLTANSNLGTLVNTPVWTTSTAPFANVIASRANIRGAWIANPNTLASSRLSVVNSSVTGTNFAVFGHDSGTDGWQTTDVPANCANRLTRVWRAEVTGSATGDIKIDTTGLSNIGNGSGLRLLVDSDGTFASGATALTGTYSTPYFTVSGHSITNGSYYTLASLTFTELDPGFRAAGWYARAAWGDYDNDGDLDLFLAGYDAGATPKASARIYRNHGDGTFTDLNAGLPNVEFGAWGDYDRDGDLDLVVSGLVYETNTRVTEIYRNDNGSFVSLNAGLTPVEYAELAWGDYDNDGDLDLVVAGDDATGVPRTTLYRNDGGVFVNANAGLLGVDSAGLAWGDYDNDGDLDLALSGYTGPGASHARLYRN
ncbi:MAG: FG-GAP-like repeat-containing protein, partial [Verrucomicrobia bacterium]|nr:FG-GAP-like repeat-containing protein [Verrucomicrobiota bacterium]